jgi:GTPase Era involved in 16S rRNA processing
MKDANVRAGSGGGFGGGTDVIGRMMMEAWEGALDADVAILLVDAARRLGDAEMALAHQFSSNFPTPEAAAAAGAPVSSVTKRLLVLNKIDLVRDRTDMLPLIERLTAICEFDAVFLISALRYDGVEDLKDFLFAMSARRPWEHAPDADSEMTDQQRCAEIIREKLYQRLNQEVPYAVEQQLGEWRELSDDEFRELQRRFNTESTSEPAADPSAAPVASSEQPAYQDFDATLLGDAEVAVPEAPAVRNLNSLAKRSPTIAKPSPAASTPSSADKPKALRIVQFLHVTKDSQAKILVGHGGATLKAITARAQEDLERLLSRPVVLSLRVRLKSGKRDHAAASSEPTSRDTEQRDDVQHANRQRELNDSKFQEAMRRL